MQSASSKRGGRSDAKLVDIQLPTSTSRTSSVYAIAPGPLLLTGDAETLPSTGETFVRKGKVFCLEKTGLFGSAEKVSPAGTFTATTKPLASDATPSRVAFAGSVVATVVAAPVDRTMSVVLRPKPRAT